MGHVSAPGLDIALKNASLLQWAKVLRKFKKIKILKG
jgi:hypothetical protein